MPQPPNIERVQHVITRARILHGDHTADVLADSFLADWEASEAEGPHAQALQAAGWQLLRAATYRAGGNESVANMCCHLAEAAIAGWRDEMIVRTASVEETP